MITDVEIAMADAVAAARAEFARHGIDPAAVVVNVEWRADDVEFVAGSRAPDRPSPILAESLRQSADEIEG